MQFPTATTTPSELNVSVHGLCNTAPDVLILNVSGFRSFPRSTKRTFLPSSTSVFANAHPPAPALKVKKWKMQNVSFSTAADGPAKSTGNIPNDNKIVCFCSCIHNHQEELNQGKEKEPSTIENHFAICQLSNDDLRWCL
jgi:hypothetical protein